MISIIVFSLIFAGCAPVISKGLRGAAEDVPFEEVQQHPEKYLGKTFIWGGFIAKTENTEEGYFLEVVQNPIDGYGRVIDKDKSGGRFLAFTKKHLDPLIYKKGREITVGGILTESRKQPLGKTEYNYPVLDNKELYLWSEESYYYFYDYPYYYPGYPYYPQDPFLYRQDLFWPYYPPTRYWR